MAALTPREIQMLDSLIEKVVLIEKESEKYKYKLKLALMSSSDGEFFDIAVPKFVYNIKDIAIKVPREHAVAFLNVGVEIYNRLAKVYIAIMNGTYVHNQDYYIQEVNEISNINYNVDRVVQFLVNNGNYKPENAYYKYILEISNRYKYDGQIGVYTFLLQDIPIIASGGYRAFLEKKIAKYEHKLRMLTKH